MPKHTLTLDNKCDQFLQVQCYNGHFSEEYAMQRSIHSFHWCQMVFFFCNQILCSLQLNTLDYIFSCVTKQVPAGICKPPCWINIFLSIWSIYEMMDVLSCSLAKPFYVTQLLQLEQLGLTVRCTGFAMSALTSLMAATMQLPPLLQLRQQRVYYRGSSSSSIFHCHAPPSLCILSGCQRIWSLVTARSIKRGKLPPWEQRSCSSTC